MYKLMYKLMCVKKVNHDCQMQLPQIGGKSTNGLPYRRPILSYTHFYEGDWKRVLLSFAGNRFQQGYVIRQTHQRLNYAKRPGC